jgi:hypothetical protein
MSKEPKNIKEAFSYTTAVAGTTWDPTVGRTPFNVVTGMGYLEDIIKGKPRQDEKEARAPKILPFPLDRITDQLATSYEDLMKIKTTLLVTIRTALLTKEEKAMLRLDVKYVDHCMDTIKKISKDVERVYL